MSAEAGISCRTHGSKCWRFVPIVGYSAFVPNGTSIRTMEYAMARELYLYTKANMSPLASDFIRFCKSDAGHAVADEAGFLDSRKRTSWAPPAFGDNAPADLVSAVKGRERIVISFRFLVATPIGYHQLPKPHFAFPDAQLTGIFAASSDHCRLHGQPRIPESNEKLSKERASEFEKRFGGLISPTRSQRSLDLANAISSITTTTARMRMPPERTGGWTFIWNADCSPAI